MEQYRPEKQESSREMLRGLVSRVSEEINAMAQEKYGMDTLVDERGAINIDEFADTDGFSRERTEKDKKEAYEKEVEWSGAHDENVREFYASKYGAKTKDDIVRIHTENKENEKNRQMEMFVTALFHKMLKHDFIVVSVSKPDDYFNGIDTVMVNRKTGDIVCAFDEVHDHKDSERVTEKEEKIKKKAREGGSTLSYGITMKNGKLVREEIKNLPVFFLSLSTEDLEDVLKKMNYGMSVSMREIEIFRAFLDSLEDQQKMLLAEDTPNPVRENLIRFGDSLSTMKESSEPPKG